MCVALVAGVHNGNTPAAVAGAAGRCWGPSSSMAMPRGGVITVMHPLRQAAEICNQFAVCARLLPPPSPSRPHIILRRAATQMKTSEQFSPPAAERGLQTPTTRSRDVRQEPEARSRRAPWPPLQPLRACCPPRYRHPLGQPRNPPSLVLRTCVCGSAAPCLCHTSAFQNARIPPARVNEQRFTNVIQILFAFSRRRRRRCSPPNFRKQHAVSGWCPLPSSVVLGGNCVLPPPVTPPRRQPHGPRGRFIRCRTPRQVHDRLVRRAGAHALNARGLGKVESSSHLAVRYSCCLWPPRDPAAAMPRCHDVTLTPLPLPHSSCRSE